MYWFYECFEQEAKKLCANIIYEFSLNPMQKLNNGQTYTEGFGTGMAVCDPNLPHLDETCTCS